MPRPPTVTPMTDTTKLVSAFLLVTAPLAGQGVYSPPWMQSTEGQAGGYYLGRYPAGRYQLADGHVPKAGVLKDLRLRLDRRRYAVSTGAGRSFRTVTLSLGKTDLATFSSTFTANRAGTQTRVFRGSVTWPALSGTPIATVWGGAQGQYRFPFTSGYAHAGGDLLAEFEFAGGTLSNNVTWAPNRVADYWFDSYGAPNGSVSATGAGLPAKRLDNNSPGVTTRCNDAAHSVATGAYAVCGVDVFGRLYGNIPWRNKVRFYSYSYYTAFHAPVIHAYGFQTDQTGFDLGTGCNRLHINGRVVLVPLRTLPKAVDGTGYSGLVDFLFPWDVGFANVKVICQAAWDDSASGRFALTQAREITLPVAPPPSVIAARAMTYALPAGSGYPAAGLGPFPTADANPAFCYGL